MLKQTVGKAGAVGSIRFGSGLIVARLTVGSWSATSATATGGVQVRVSDRLELFVFPRFDLIIPPGNEQSHADRMSVSTRT